MSITVFCWGCGERGRMEKVAAEVQHSCGSRDVDLWQDAEDQRRRIEAVRRDTISGEPVFTEFMREAVVQMPMPHPSDQGKQDTQWPGYVGNDPEPGWDEYVGPPPGPNPTKASEPSGLHPRAPTRPQPGVEQESNLYLYDKHHPNDGYGENPPIPPVARHNYPSTQTSTPFLGRRKQGDVDAEGFSLKGASCPTCPAENTSLVLDHKDNSHWYCYRRCGSLINIDRHPTVDPYHPPERHPWGSDEFRRRGKKIFAGKKTGQLMNRIATIARVNPGLSSPEVVYLARQSVIRYPEA